MAKWSKLRRQKFFEKRKRLDEQKHNTAVDTANALSQPQAPSVDIYQERRRAHNNALIETVSNILRELWR